MIRDGDDLPEGPEHPGALDRDEQEASLAALHLRHDRPPQGRAALPSRRPRRRLVAGAPARLRLGRSHARRHAALPHDGDPLAARDAPRRRLLRPAGALGRRRGARADRGAAADLPLPGADPVPRPRPPPRPCAPRPLVRARARLRGRRDVVEPRPALRRGLSTGGLRQPLRLDRGLHVHDRAGSASASRAAPAGPRSTRGCASPTTARSPFTSPRTRLSAATGTVRTPTRRRFETAGITRATPAASTRTATSGSRVASTT